MKKLEKYKVYDHKNDIIMLMLIFIYLFLKTMQEIFQFDFLFKFPISNGCRRRTRSEYIKSKRRK